MDISHTLVIVAAVCNVAAATLNLITARRNRRSVLALRAISDHYGKAIGFAAFMASKDAGAPDEIRRLALAVIPEAIRAEVIALTKQPPHVH